MRLEKVSKGPAALPLNRDPRHMYGSSSGQIVLNLKVLYCTYCTCQLNEAMYYSY
jgi:hypothetical protein